MGKIVDRIKALIVSKKEDIPVIAPDTDAKTKETKWREFLTTLANNTYIDLLIKATPTVIDDLAIVVLKRIVYYDILWTVFWKAFQKTPLMANDTMNATEKDYECYEFAFNLGTNLQEAL